MTPTADIPTEGPRARGLQGDVTRLQDVVSHLVRHLREVDDWLAEAGLPESHPRRAQVRLAIARGSIR